MMTPYQPIPTTTATAPPPPQSPVVGVSWWTKIASSVLLVATLTGALLVAYNRCVGCVFAIALFALLTLNCIPLMPLVFFLSVAILVLHAVDYNAATIKVEVPLSNFVYVPSWDDVHRYVHVMAPKPP
jgi:hypothetical protein